MWESFTNYWLAVLTWFRSFWLIRRSSVTFCDQICFPPLKFSISTLIQPYSPLIKRSLKWWVSEMILFNPTVRKCALFVGNLSSLRDLTLSTTLLSDRLFALMATNMRRLARLRLLGTQRPHQLTRPDHAFTQLAHIETLVNISTIFKLKGYCNAQNKIRLTVFSVS